MQLMLVLLSCYTHRLLLAAASEFEEIEIIKMASDLLLIKRTEGSGPQLCLCIRIVLLLS